MKKGVGGGEEREGGKTNEHTHALTRAFIHVHANF